MTEPPLTAASSASKTVALIQARTSSSRFPRKVLEPIDGLPMIVFMARRALRAKTLDQVLVVTSTDSSDDPLAAVCAEHQIGVFRGDLYDVLARYHSAASQAGADVIVRLTGDCPLIDPAVIDAVVALRARSGADYSSNIDPPTFPDGLDVECFTRQALDRAFVEAKLPPHREHVSLWMREAQSGLMRQNMRCLVDLSALRLTVDYPDDLQLVRELWKQCGENPQIDLYDLLRGLNQRPELLAMNPHARNEGLALSLANMNSVGV
jgi:spore coat polysaccharide biosynthesis protein SpsF